MARRTACWLVLIPSGATCVQAAVAPPSTAPTAAQAESQRQAELAKVLRGQIDGYQEPVFAALVGKWTAQYGARAVAPLLSIAQDRKKTPDRTRYIALMGAAHLGGKANAMRIVPFLKDPSWMIRSGALRALIFLDSTATAQVVLPLLRDSALVVRVEAVEAVRRLRPEGSAIALLRVIHSPENYRQGMAQWVPLKALSALADLQDRSIVPELRPLLDQARDPDLVRETMRTLEALTGKRVSRALPLLAQTEAWKKQLAEMAQDSKKTATR